MIGILSILYEEAFGLDMTRFDDVYRINDHDYEIVRTIYVRSSVHGRATSVYSIRGTESSLWPADTRLTHIVHPACPAGARDTPATLRPRMLTLVDGMSELPEKMVYKLSYQTEGHTLESTSFILWFSSSLPGPTAG